MEIYPKFKKTGLDWLPEVPSHWEFATFQNIAKERKIKNIGLQETQVLSLSYGKIIVRDMEKAGLLPESFETYQIVEPGNIIFRFTDLQNDHRSLRTGIVRHRGIITSAYLCVSVNDNVIPDFLNYVLRVYDLRKVFYGYGGGVRQSIGYEEIRKLKFPVPPLDEQKRVVEYISGKNQEIEGYISAKQQMIERIKELNAVIVSDAVTGRLI